MLEVCNVDVSVFTPVLKVILSVIVLFINSLPLNSKFTVHSLLKIDLHPLNIFFLCQMAQHSALPGEGVGGTEGKRDAPLGLGPTPCLALAVSAPSPLRHGAPAGVATVSTSGQKLGPEQGQPDSSTAKPHGEKSLPVEDLLGPLCSQQTALFFPGYSLSSSRAAPMNCHCCILLSSLLPSQSSAPSNSLVKANNVL